MKLPAHTFSYIDAVERQKDIFTNGFSGMKPKIPFDFTELEQKAQTHLSPEAFGYISTGAGLGTTIKNNRRAFDKYAIVPRMLKLHEKINTSTKIKDISLSCPLFLSPIGVLSLADKNGDLSVCEAARDVNLPMIFSNQASVSMEECSKKMGNSTRWFQLYHSQIEELSQSLIQRAEDCGCSAIVITLDTTKLGWRPIDLKNGYLPFLEGKGLAQYTSDPKFMRIVKEAKFQPSSSKITYKTILNAIRLKRRMKPFTNKMELGNKGHFKIVQQFIKNYTRADLSWQDVMKIKSWTNLPVFLKGIVNEVDALEAQNKGFDGIIVSNHGGRQVDGAFSSLDALVNIRKIVDEDYCLILDSGIRCGADMFKAIALGANAVCLGRPFVYALAIGGMEGVRELLVNYRADFELTMTLSGCHSIASINSTYVKST